MRCPECNKFVSVETDDDPEVDNLEVSDGRVTGTVRIQNNCAECSTGLREATFDIDAEIPADFLEVHGGDHHELEASDSLSRTDRYKGKGRRAAHLYGVEGTLTVECSCGESVGIDWSDEAQASAMDEM